MAVSPAGKQTKHGFYPMDRNIIPTSLVASSTVSLLVALLGLTPVHAANWQVYKYIDADVTATDNLQLGDGTEELVYSVKPSVELSFEGQRFETDIIAGIEAYRFNERGDSFVDPRLEVGTSGTLVNNLLYINSSLEVGKLLPEEDFFDLNEDSETQSRIKINPFVSRKFGRFADLYFGYGHQSLDNESDGDVDTSQDTLDFSLGRNPKYGGFIWGVGATYARDRADDDTFDSTSAYGTLGATVGQSLYLQLLAGGELNDFASRRTDAIEQDDESVLWELSLNWTPNERTSLKVGYGDRFFGEGPTFSFKQRLRNSTLSATYTRDVASANVNIGSVTPFAELANNRPVTPTGAADLTDNNVGSALFVDKRLQFGYKLAGRRSDLVIDGLYSDREEINGDETREKLIGRVAFDRHLSPLTTVRLQYEHLISEDNDVDRANENRVGLSLIYNFDRKERGSILAEDDE